jgi:hypothetical protein
MVEIVQMKVIALFVKCTAYGICECTSPTECADVSQRRCHNCSCGTTAAEKAHAISHVNRDYPNRQSSKVLCDDQLALYRPLRTAHLLHDDRPLHQLYAHLPDSHGLFILYNNVPSRKLNASGLKSCNIFNFCLKQGLTLW